MPPLNQQSGTDPTAKEMRNAAEEFGDLNLGLEAVVELLLLMALTVERSWAKIDARERAAIDEALRLLASRAAELRGEVEQPPSIASVLSEALKLSRQLREAVK